MVEPAKNRGRHNLPEPVDRGAPQRTVSSYFIIIGDVFRKNSSKVLSVEHDK
jgi:hypothetical protein